MVGAPVGEGAAVGGGSTAGDCELAAGVEVAKANDGEADGPDPAWQALTRTAATTSRSAGRCMGQIVPDAIRAMQARSPHHLTPQRPSGDASCLSPRSVTG